MVRTRLVDFHDSGLLLPSCEPKSLMCRRPSLSLYGVYPAKPPIPFKGEGRVTPVTSLLLVLRR